LTKALRAAKAGNPLNGIGRTVQQEAGKRGYKVEGKKTSLVRGEAWILRKDQEKEKLDEGRLIVLQEA
jgi:hypothetical protein